MANDANPYRISKDKVAAAHREGYSDAEIVEHLSQRSGVDPAKFKEAVAEGYTPAEILSHLGDAQHNPPSSIVDALSQGAANTVRGIGQSIGAVPGGSQDTERRAEQIAGTLEPKNYQPAQVIKDGAINFGDIPRAVAEQAPGAVLPIATGAVLKRFLGRRLGLLGGLAAAGAEYFGPNVKARATAEGHEEPTATDKAIGAGTTAAQLAADAIALRRFLPGANPITTVGVQGILDSAKKLAATTAIEAASTGGQNVIGQAGATMGTPGGLQVDPEQAASAAITGGATGGVLASPRLGRDAVNAARFSDVGGPLATPASAVANRILQKVKDGDALNPKTAYGAVSDTTADVLNELKNARAGLNKGSLSTEADNALARVAAGRQVSSTDLRAIEQSAPTGVHDLASQASVLASLKQKGNYGSERFGGGLGERLRHAMHHPLSSAGSVAALIASPMIAAKAALAGGALYGGARVLDRALGLASPAATFVEKFSNPSVPTRSGVAPVVNSGRPSVPSVGARANTTPIPPAVQALASQAALASQVRQGASPPPPAALPAPTTALVTKITKAKGETKEQSSAANAAGHAAIEEIPTPQGLLHTEVSPADHEIAHAATEQFKAAGNVPPVVASRYYNSTAQRQARIRDRLLAISGDPKFPSEDLQLGEALDKLRHVRSREALARHIEDLASTVKPEVANVLRAYFGPVWAKSVWNPSR